MSEIKIYEKETKITNCYEIENNKIDGVVGMLIRERIMQDYEVTRPAYSYAREIRTHKRLYKMGLFKKHTKDADLEEPICFVKELIYGILGK